MAKIPLDSVSLVVKYSPDYPNLLITPDGGGQIYIANCLRPFDYKLPDPPQVAEIEPERKFRIHEFPIFDIDWHDKSTKFITGSADLACAIYDTETMSRLYQGYSHTRSVRSVKSCEYNSSLFVSGGRDGQLMIWDTRLKPEAEMINDDGTILADISGNVIEQGKEEIESFTGVSFYHDEKTVLSVQANDSYIKVWDLRKMSDNKGKKKPKKSTKAPVDNPCLMLRVDKTLAFQNKVLEVTDRIREFSKSEIKTKDDIKALWALYEDLKLQNSETLLKEESVKGFSSLYLSRKQDKLLVSQLDHTLQLYNTDFIEKQPPKAFKGHKASLYVRSVLSPCNNFVASGSTDQGVHIWRADAENTKQPLISLYSGHHAEVNCLDWSPISSNFLASVGDDQFLVLWDYALNH